MIVFILLAMIFCHIVDDYYLQGWLASAKQKQWWTDNAPQKMYKYDYVVALFMHSFSWAFMVMLPIAIFNGFNIDFQFVWYFVCNLIIHGAVDNLKANEKLINLMADQSIHVIQILFTFLFLVVI